MEMEWRGGKVTTRTAYQIGRLLAALEHLGTPDPRRLYELASVEPVHLVQMLNRVTADGGQEAEEILLPIVAQLPPDAFAGTLNAEAQSEFALGYYHQRAEFRAGRLPALPESEPDLDDRWEIRIEPDLKRWALDNGGSRLVRALLRTAREQHEK